MWTRLWLGLIREGIHPRWMQVTQVSWSGDPSSEAYGTVVYRTLFGIPVGSGRLSGQEWLNLHPGRWLLVWLAFLTAEVLGAVYVTGVYLIWRPGW